MIKMAQNPYMALTQMAQSNPSINEIMKMCQGKDPKAVFYDECQKRGINPEDILNQLK